MFLKTTKNSSGQQYHQLVESYRNEQGKVRQRVLLSLGRVEDNGVENLLQVLSKHKKRLEAIDLANDVSVDKTYIFGPLLLLGAIFEKVQVRAILEQVQTAHPKLEFDLVKVLFTMVVSRFVAPCSKLKLYEHWQRQFFSTLLMEEISLHQIYRSLDLFCDHKEEIEKALYWRERDLFDQRSDVVLYDLTTLRFESTKETEDLRRFGFSKEKRSDCTQVVFGLLLDTLGIPLGFEVYPGNTFEGQTLENIVTKFKKKFTIRRFIFVADRGLFSKKNLDILRSDRGEFIVGHKLGTMSKDKKNEIYDINRFTFVVRDELAVYEEQTEAGDRLIVTWSRKRAERDEKTRNDILEKIRKKLGTKKVTAKKFVSNSNYQKFVKGLDQGKPEINEKAILEASKKDGFFGIVTNVKDLSSAEIVLNYKELWKIEDAFGEIKGTLKSRPVFHWTDRRIIGHLTVCFLSYYCEAITTKYLRDKRAVLKNTSIENGLVEERPLTVVEAMKELREVRAIPVRIQDQIVWVRTDITGNAATILQAVGCRIPPKVIDIQKVSKL